MGRSFGLALCLALGLTSLSGCGKSTTRVNGKVTYRGKPVVVGNVTIIASDNMSHAGLIQPGGDFTIENVPPGPCRIGVTSNNPTSQNGRKSARVQSAGKGVEVKFTPPKEGDTTSAGWFEIPQKYSDPVNSGLTGEIVAGTPLNIDLP